MILALFITEREASTGGLVRAVSDTGAAVGLTLVFAQVGCEKATAVDDEGLLGVSQLVQFQRLGRQTAI